MTLLLVLAWLYTNIGCFWMGAWWMDSKAMHLTTARRVGGAFVALLIWPVPMLVALIEELEER